MIASLFIQAVLLMLFKERYSRHINYQSWQRLVYAAGLVIFGAEFVVTTTYLLWRYLP